MRFALCLVVLSACFGVSDRAAIAPDNGSGSNGVGAGIPYCDADGDCALAASTCCACPSFAIAADNDSFSAQCMAIVCPMQACPAMVARCVEHACAVACAPTACDVSCTDGYAVDAGGCQTCACATPPPDACGSDGDCTEVPADCCGCASGGSDTAVRSADAASYEAMLACPPTPNCPGTNTCEPGSAARCVSGQCTLSSSGLPPGACGRRDLPACPSPQQCILNASPDATAEGVGLCGTP